MEFNCFFQPNKDSTLTIVISLLYIALFFIWPNDKRYVGYNSQTLKKVQQNLSLSEKKFSQHLIIEFKLVFWT